MQQVRVIKKCGGNVFSDGDGDGDNNDDDKRSSVVQQHPMEININIAMRSVIGILVFSAKGSQEVGGPNKKWELSTNRVHSR